MLWEQRISRVILFTGYSTDRVETEAHFLYKQYLQIHTDTGPEFKQQEAECDIAHDHTSCYHRGQIIHGL